jgi:hypothetical protein
VWKRRERSPVSYFAEGLILADAVIVVRILMSHLSRTGKEIGLAAAGALAVVDGVWIYRVRRRYLAEQASEDGLTDA